MNPEKDKLLNYNSAELEDCDSFPEASFSITHFDESLKAALVVSSPTGKHIASLCLQMGTRNALHLYNNMLQLIPNPNETTISIMLLNIKLYLNLKASCRL